MVLKFISEFWGICMEKEVSSINATKCALADIFFNKDMNLLIPLMLASAQWDWEVLVFFLVIQLDCDDRFNRTKEKFISCWQPLFRVHVSYIAQGSSAEGSFFKSPEVKYYVPPCGQWLASSGQKVVVSLDELLTHVDGAWWWNLSIFNP